MPEFDEATIERLERQAQVNPAAYKRELFFLALLGYCYVALVVFGLLFGTALVLGLLYISHAYVLIKFAILLLGAVGIILKSMWVKYTRPEGYELKRAEVPKLFELVDEVQQKSGGPHIHKILLDSNFNCAVSQFPRLGILGLYENYVILGLPLLDSLSVQEFKSILAHEMGHLSAQHGKFGSWIYHVKRSWLQTYVNMSVNKLGFSPIKKFADWFVPKFEVQSLALCREQELAADRISREICGGQIAANALIKVEVKSGFLDKEYWPSVSKEIRTNAEPISGVFFHLRSAAREAIAPTTVLEILQSKWRKHNLLDSHPSLSERVAVLQPRRDWSDLNALANELALEVDEKPNAAEALLGDHLRTITDELSSEWQKAALPRWTMEHEVFTKNKNAFTELRNKIPSSGPTVPQGVDLARLSLATMEAADAANFIVQIVRLHPDNSEIAFYYGVALIRAKSPEGISIIEKVVKEKPGFGPEGYGLIAHFLYSRGKTEDAEKYAQLAEELAIRAQKALAVASKLTLEDKFEEHRETPEKVEEICNTLYANPSIKEAFLVSKVVDDIIGGSQTVLVLKLDKPFWAFNDLEFGKKVIGEVLRYQGLAGCYVVSWVSVKTNLAQSVQIIDGAHIYERKSFHANLDSFGYNDAISKHKAKGAFKPAPLAINYTNVILLIVIAVFLALLCGTLSSHQSANNRPSNRYQQARYDNNEEYMRAIQHAIRLNWHPPRMKQSCRTVVTFKISPAGQISNVRTYQSSGDEIMDQAGIDAVLRSSPLPPLPAIDSEAVDVQFSLDYNVAHSNNH